ncbi:MAG: restriction endonuclease subunit S [Solirubrobacteraceae bacterium]
MTAFPPTWDVSQLGDLVDILDSRRIPLNATERASRSGDVPYFGATGQVGWIDEPIFNEPLILLGEDGVQFFEASKQKAYLIEGPAWVNNHAHVLRPRPDVDRAFLSYYLNAADYRGLANGTTRLKLTQAAMRRIPVPLPALSMSSAASSNSSTIISLASTPPTLDWSAADFGSRSQEKFSGGTPFGAFVAACRPCLGFGLRHLGEVRRRRSRRTGGSNPQFGERRNRPH